MVLTRTDRAMIEKEFALLKHLEDTGVTPRPYELTYTTVPHPHDSEESAQITFLVMEHIEGRPLTEVARDLQVRGETEVFVGEERWAVVLSLVDVLKIIHGKGVVHKDIKMSNVMVEGARVRVVDLGLSRLVGEDGLCKDLGGTLEYLSPEVLMKQPHGCEVDMWAFGVLMHELFTGQRPLRRTEIEEVRRGKGGVALQEAFVKAAREAVMKNLEHRPQLCRAVLRCMEGVPEQRRLPETGTQMPF